jgi:epoxyqueuosine reductase
MDGKYVDGTMQGAAGKVSIDDMTGKIKELALDYGATIVGINTIDSLAGGPASTDLNYVLKGARSAITFGVPMDQEHILNFLAKRDQHGHQRDQNLTTALASGVGAVMASYLSQFGAEAVAVLANAVYRHEEGSKYIEQKPDLSHRFLAVRCGLGWFGFSGNVLTPEHGPNVNFATVVTDVPLRADEPLPEEDNYCDECQACNASCPSGFFRFGRKEKVTINMGGHDFTYTKRRDYSRCTYVCAGYNGLHPNGRWSTWAPGRFPIPNDDKELRSAFRKVIPSYNNRPAPSGAVNKQPMVFGFGGRDLSTSCGNCALVCHPDREERDRRINTLRNSGVVVQHDNGDLEAMAPADARAFLDAMPVEKRQLFETIEEADRENSSQRD